MTRPVDAESFCAFCQKPNEPGMSFCMHCGQHLPHNAASVLEAKPKNVNAEKIAGGQDIPGDVSDTDDLPVTCPSCGKVDNLNHHFCIYCGAATTVEAAPPAVHRRQLPSSWLTAACSVLGIAAALVLANFTPTSWIQELIVHSSWPRQGLVIYARPAGCQVSVEEMNGRTVTLGLTGTDGTLSLSDLAPGDYQVILSKDGYHNLVREIQVKSQSVTVLGFPAVIQLLNQSTQSQQLRMPGSSDACPS